MSYQVLARKWRPRYFSEMVGQEHVLQTLSNALDNNRLHHAYLFTGDRGVGKTTIARVLSKCLNCETRIQSVPCGECSSCREISEGRFIDLIEVDAASQTKIEDTRDLLDRVHYLPTRARYKIYLIDEVHMLSRHSFNALLKTLEEPPAHVKFLLATTDPQKLPVTVLSRCLQFNLKNLSPEKIAGHLGFVLGEESIPFDKIALGSLARAAEGSMRDALSLTDQAIGYGNGEVRSNAVHAMLGTIERSHVMGICQALALGNGVAMLACIEQMAEHAPDYRAALSDILSLWHQVAILQAVPEGLDSSAEGYAGLVDLAEQVSREDTQLYYQMCLMGRQDLKMASDERVAFEMVMLRALAFKPKRGSPIKVSKEHKVTSGTASSARVNLGESAKINSLEAASSTPPITDVGVTQLIPVQNPPAPLQRSSAVDGVALDALSPDTWLTVRRQVKIAGSLGEIASHCVFSGQDRNTLLFILNAEHGSFLTDAHQDGLSAILGDYFGAPVQVKISLGEASVETPREADLRESKQRQDDAVATLNDDPEIVKFKQVFNGTLDMATVVSKEKIGSEYQ